MHKLTYRLPHLVTWSHMESKHCKGAEGWRPREKKELDYTLNVGVAELVRPCMHIINQTDHGVMMEG